MNPIQIRTIAEQHPESVALVFEAFNILAEVNERNLLNAIKIFGKPFVADLEEKTGESLSFFGGKKKRGPELTPAQTIGAKEVIKPKTVHTGKVEQRSISKVSANAQPQKQGFNWDKAADIAGNIIGLASGRKRLGYYEEGGLATERVFGISRPLFILLAVLIVIAIAITIYRKK